MTKKAWPRNIMMQRYLTFADLQGLSGLALEATENITDLVEEVHATVTTPLRLFGPQTPGRTRGIPGLVYRSLHVSYGLVGRSLDVILGQLAEAFDTPSTSPERDALLATLNGVWGDHLVASGNPLAIDISLRNNGRSLILEKDAIRAAIPEANGKVLVLVHGLCMSDREWTRGGHDHGAALARDLGYTPIYLHYNSGLHTSINGRDFASLLEGLVAAWPHEIEELTVIGFSMGGLVARSACHYGTLAGHAWPAHLEKLVCLGTPHHGSRLERAGNWFGEHLAITRYSAPFKRLGTHRSAGITDLRHGNIIEEDWAGLDRFGHHSDSRRPAPLLAGVRHYAMGATLGARRDDVKDALLGDGIVSLASALGLHKDPERCLTFPEANRWVGFDMGHLDLLSRAEVYVQIREWLST